MVLGDRPVDERIDWMMAQLQRARFSEAKLEEVTLRLSQKRAALERADRAKDELLSMLAHELRNPLGTISNALQVLRMTGEGDETCEAGDRRRRAPGRSIRRVLIDDLLEASRVTRGKIELQCEELDLAELVRETVEGYRGALEEAGLDARASTSPQSRRCGSAATVSASRRRSPTCWTTPPSSPPGAAASPCGPAARRRPARRGQRPRHRRRHPPGRAPLRLRGLHARPTTASTAPRAAWASGSPSSKGLIDLHGGEVEARSEGPGQGSEFCYPAAADRAGRRRRGDRPPAEAASRAPRRAGSWWSRTTPTPPPPCATSSSSPATRSRLAASGTDGVQAARALPPRGRALRPRPARHDRLRGGRPPCARTPRPPRPS